MSKYLFIVIFMLVSIFSLYFYYTQNKIQSLIGENGTLKVANETNQETITFMEENQKENARRIRELQVSLDKSEEDLDVLRKTLSEHDLTRLAAKKPGLIEKRMQGATDELFKNYFNSGNSVSP